MPHRIVSHHASSQDSDGQLSQPRNKRTEPNNPTTSGVCEALPPLAKREVFAEQSSSQKVKPKVSRANGTRLAKSQWRKMREEVRK